MIELPLLVVIATPLASTSKLRVAHRVARGEWNCRRTIASSNGRKGDHAVGDRDFGAEVFVAVALITPEHD